jgi:hypothetical protein
MTLSPMTKPKTKTAGEIAGEYRNIATDAVRILKDLPIGDVKLAIEIDSLFDRLADNDIAIQDMIRKDAVARMTMPDVTSN